MAELHDFLTSNIEFGNSDSLDFLRHVGVRGSPFKTSAHRSTLLIIASISKNNVGQAQKRYSAYGTLLYRANAILCRKLVPFHNLRTDGGGLEERPPEPGNLITDFGGE